MRVLSAICSAVRGWIDRRRERPPEWNPPISPGRYQAVAGGRALGRSYTMAQVAQRYAVRPNDWRGYTTTATTLDEATSLTQADLTRAYEAMQQHIEPREPQMVAQARLIEEHRRRQEEAMARHQAKKDAEELNKQLAEPFWAWHDRRENENQRVDSNDSATSSTDIRVQRGPRPDGNISDAVAYSLRAGRMGIQGAHWENAQSARVDQA